MLEWLGACCMALERWEEARTALEKAVELDPSRTSAQELLDDLTAQGH
jgi:Flp pilus assembly protein TadD